MAQHPDAFLTHRHASDAEILTHIVREQAANLKNPQLSVADVLDTLAQHVPTTVSLLRTAMAARGEPSDSL